MAHLHRGQFKRYPKPSGFDNLPVDVKRKAQSPTLGLHFMGSRLNIYNHQRVTDIINILYNQSHEDL